MTSQKTKNRLRALRQKYHLGEFRKNKAPAHNRKITKKGGFIMAKRHSRRHARRGGSSKSYGLVGKLLGAAAYGLVRQKISDKLAPLTSKIPLGNISDEVGMGAAAMLTKKFLGKKVKMLVPICDAAMIIEAARIGEAVATQGIGNLISGGVSTNDTF